jgi:hypothetical protein
MIPKEKEIKLFATVARYCYAADNCFAYKFDLYGKEPTDKNFERVYADSKITNFVPTYDNWCLYCDNKSAKMRCSGCRHVYFCNPECQKKAWKIHKKHCKRVLFWNCASCGSKLTTEKFLKCDGCPIGWCNEKCKVMIYQLHKEIDCNNLQKLFL